MEIGLFSERLTPSDLGTRLFPLAGRLHGRQTKVYWFSKLLKFHSGPSQQHLAIFIALLVLHLWSCRILQSGFNKAVFQDAYFSEIIHFHSNPYYYISTVIYAE